MPEPYILDPFQRIVSFNLSTITFEYRASPCGGNTGGASYERRQVTTFANGSQTFGAWTSIGGSCTTNTAAPARLYLQPYGTAPFSTSNIAQFGTTNSEGVNVSIYGVGFRPTGLPSTLTNQNIAPVYYDCYINGSLYVTTQRDTADFYDRFGGRTLIGGYNTPGNVMPVMTLNSLPPVGQGNTPYPPGTLNAESYSNVRTYRIFNFGAGAVYSFRVNIRIPGYGYNRNVYNQMLWA